MQDFPKELRCVAVADFTRPNEPRPYVLHIDGRGGQLAAGCSDGRSWILDPVSLRQIRCYESPWNSKGVNVGLRCGKDTPTLYSALKTGEVYCWDTRVPGNYPMAAFQSYPRQTLASFDVDATQLLLTAGTELRDEDAFVLFWDVRAGHRGSNHAMEPMGVYSESHSNDITQICFHPTCRDRLATGSADGLVNVFDLQQSMEEHALTLTCNSESSVASIAWEDVAKGEGRLFCTTHTEGLWLWNIGPDGEDKVEDIHVEDVRRKDIVGGVELAYLVGGFSAAQDEGLIVVGGASTGHIHLLQLQKEGLVPLLQFLSPKPETLTDCAPVRCFHWFEGGAAESRLVTGDEDGQLVLWAVGENSSESLKRSCDESESTADIKSLKTELIPPAQSPTS
uniref:WD repeat-containing protein 89 n=1 Tax=Myxine glutinosa TaxID=7769 RepID=UPI00358FA630